MKSLRNPFIKQWILFNYLGWLAGMLVGYLLDSVFIFPHAYFWQTPPLYKVLEPIFLSIPLGIGLGTMQGLVIRRWKLLFSSWIRISILGSIIATIINIWLFHIGILGKDISDIFLAPIFDGVIVAVFQSIFLCKSISQSMLWVSSHLFGFFVALIMAIVIYSAAFIFATPIIKALEVLQLWYVVWNRDSILILFNILIFPIWISGIVGSMTGNNLSKTLGNTQTG